MMFCNSLSYLPPKIGLQGLLPPDTPRITACTHLTSQHPATRCVPGERPRHEHCPRLVSHFCFNPGVLDNRTLDQYDHAPCATTNLQTAVGDWAYTCSRQPRCRGWTNPSLQTVVRGLACTHLRQLRCHRWTNPSVIRERVHS